jgi:hypothetical protein
MSRITHLGHDDEGFYAMIVDKDGDPAARHPLSAQSFADTANTLLQYVLERGLEVTVTRPSHWPAHKS